MTPGSAGGELGDHRALRRDETHPRPLDSTSSPSLPIPQPPISFCQPREEFEERWLCSIDHGSARPPPTASLPTVIQTWKYRGGKCSPEVVIVEATFSLDHGCLADKQAALSGKCHTKGNSLLKLLSFFFFLLTVSVFETGRSAVCLV